MSGRSDDDAFEVPHPRETTVLFGHGEAERRILDAYRAGRFPHAWLIGGPRGIGKATLAYRVARFVLAHPDPSAADVQAVSSLALAEDDPVARKVAAQSHGGLLTLERTVGDTGKLRQDIAVDDVRRSIPFFGSTASEGGWRIAIVDAVDELNRSGANALLKIIEEPPRHALLLLVCHAMGAVLPTIRSRCRVLQLRPLPAAEVMRGVTAIAGPDIAEADLQEATALAEGSIGRALSLLSGGTLALRRRIAAALETLPDVDRGALHGLGDAIAGSGPEPLAAFVDTVNTWLSARLGKGAGELDRMARLAEAFERVNQAARDVDAYNLDRKPFVFTTFGLLAEAARG